MPSIHSDVIAARRGDTAAFARLVDRHTDAVAAITTAILGSPDAGEEVGQEVFVCAWEGLDRLQDPERFAPWLRQIARNRSHEALRRRLQRREVPPDALAAVAAPGLDAGERLDSEREEAALWAALEELDEAHREVLVLYYRQGRSVRQVAEQLGLTEPTARKRLSRARARLRDGVEEALGRRLQRPEAKRAALAAAVATAIAVLPARSARAGQLLALPRPGLAPLVAAATAAIALLASGGLATTAHLHSQLPPIEAPGPRTVRLAAHGTRDQTPPTDDSAPPAQPSNTQIPDHVVHAFLAAEDARFFEHGGVDPQAVGRAALHNLIGGSARQGGSTLTQQLAKRMLIEQRPDPTLSRKLSEVVLALELEHRLSKEQILQLYLDEVYLGAGAEGLDDAAERYFGKPVGALSLAEGALLATLPASPTAHSPITDPQGALQRRAHVLQRMQAQGWASPGAVATALAEPLWSEEP